MTNELLLGDLDQKNHSFTKFKIVRLNVKVRSSDWFKSSGDLERRANDQVLI